MKILGIDPGIERVGWGIVETKNGTSTYQLCGCITTSKTLSQQERLFLISQELSNIIEIHNPDRVVIEKLFFATNKKTAMAVAESRGAILLVLWQKGLPVKEFTPLEVKLAIAGTGRAEKKQIAWVVRNILKLESSITSDDAIDALALCLMVT